MCRRLTAMAAGVLLCLTTSLSAEWILLDDFNGTGDIGEPNWFQTTPLSNFYMGNGRLLNKGKAMAIYQGFPATGGDVRVRFQAYSGQPGVGNRDSSAQTLSAVIGAKDPNNYYEVRLLSDNLNSTDFYRLHFYTVLNGLPTHDKAIDLGQMDCVQLDAWLDGSTVKVSVQQFNRSTGLSIGSALASSFSPVPAVLANDAGAVHVGLAGQGDYVAIDKFEGFIAPEATTFMSATVLCLLLLRRRRYAR